MGAHHAALPFQALPASCDRQVCNCAVASQFACVRLLHGDSVRTSAGGRLRLNLRGGSAAIRGEARETARGDDDEPKHPLFRSPGGTFSVHKQLDHQHPLANRSVAKTEGQGMDDTTSEDAEDGSALEYSGYPLFCDVLPRSQACEPLRVASRICDEVDSKLKLHKSKKPQRLSTNSWDILE